MRRPGRAGSIEGEMMTRSKGKDRKGERIDAVEAEKGPAEQSRLEGEIREIMQRVVVLMQEQMHSSRIEMIQEETAELYLRLAEKQRELAKLRASSATGNPGRKAIGV
jgi:hypothetical protein